MFTFTIQIDFRYKLERGSLTAFKREARNIIERDLPLILHRDNIIKVFTDKVRSILNSAMQKFIFCAFDISEPTPTFE